MVNHPHNNLFNRGDTERQIKIAFSGGTITNKEMHQGSFSLTESLCSEESLRFGRCESSVLQFKVHNVLTPLVGEKLTVYEVLNGNTAEPFNYGKYKVQSDKPAADRKYRDVVAYDSMYDILNADVASWYNGLTFPCTIGYFRKQFLKHLGIEYVDTELVNDGIYIKKTIDPQELSGKQVINAICEINGCFGHINRQGKFEYITLKEHEGGLFPSETLYPSDTLFPRDPEAEENFSTSKYISCKYEDFYTSHITGLQIRQEENDIGVQVGTYNNLYIIENNFLVYGKSSEELEEIANNLLSVISKISYVPISSLKTNGKPYLEVGDRLVVATKEKLFRTYIFERTISGLNGQKDEFISNGTEVYGNKVNGIKESIIRLQGKANKLTRTVEETRLEMIDIEKGLRSEILATAEQISLKVSSEEVESMISVALDEVVISSSQIRLEGYTTINGGFSIDENGNAIMKSGSYVAQMTSSAFTVGSYPYYALLAGNSLTFANGNGALNGISTINGKEVITPDNISSYVTDYSADIETLYKKTSALDTDVSNALSDAQFALDATAENSTEIINIKSTISGIETELGNLSNQYWSLDRRISALEGGS